MKEMNTMPMHIALLNMMPDAALKATDRQLTRLLAGRPDAVLHPFTYPEIPRTPEAADYITQHYRPEAEVRALLPAALIITGANVSDPRLERQVFWEPLQETLAWSLKNTRSTTCFCLASHAVMQFRHGRCRTALPTKIWGVFEHEVRRPDHPLVQGLPARVPVPQSRFNQITENQFKKAGLDVLIASERAGVHLAAEPDGRLILMQGHPEYDDVSLLKEYKREVRLHAEGVRADFPPIPEGMVDAAGEAILMRKGTAFKEEDVKDHLHERWRPAAERVFCNWLDGL